MPRPRPPRPGRTTGRLNMASNCSLPVAKTMSSAKHSDHDIAQAARFTLLSINQHRSIGQLALRYAHVGDAHSKHIAYATGKTRVSGPKFAELERSEERSEGKECDRTCRSRWSP